MIKWEEGRQGSGYFKKKLLESKFFKFDCYILKYPTGSYIKPHNDRINGYEHHRINIVLNSGFLGGDFVKWNNEGHTIPRKRFIKFRPDIENHSLTEVRSGVRYVLSIGWLRKEK